MAHTPKLFPSGRDALTCNKNMPYGGKLELRFQAFGSSHLLFLGRAMGLCLGKYDCQEGCARAPRTIVL